MRVLVTGGTGFIGRQTLRPLVEAGFDVQLVTRRGEPAADGVTVIAADLLAPGAAAAVVEQVRPSHMLHLAWYVTPGQVWNSLENLRWAEVSLALLRAFIDAGGKRVVMAGTCSEYAPTDEPCHEFDTPTQPATLYGASKDAVRALGERAAAHAGIDFAWARVFLAYGPHEDPVRLVASITRNLLAGRPAPCSHGRQVRDYLYTPDIADALVALLRSDLTGPVNVGSGETVTLRDIIDHIGERTGRPDLIEYGAITPPPHEQPVLTADVTRLREALGWTPSHSLEEGLDETIAWWRSQAVT